MDFKKYAILLIILSLFVFTVACNEDSSTEPDTAAAQAEIELQMQAMDQMVGEAAGGPMLSAMLQFQTISTELLGGISIPMVSQVVENYSLKKFSGIDRFKEVKLDTGIVAIFSVLEVLKGTHTYNPADETWTHTDSPDDAVVFIFPVIGTDATSQQAVITIDNISLANESAGFDLKLTVNFVTVFTMDLTVTGTNFVIPFTESSITGASITGNIVSGSGISAAYSVTATNTAVTATIGAAGLTGMTVTAEGNDLLSTSTDDPTSNVEKITVAVGENIELVITDPTADTGKVGEVYYKGDDVGDIVMVDEDIRIKYAGGDEVSFTELMPNTFTLIAVIGGITG